MTDSSIKVELYDAAVCVLRESSSTAVEECIHEVGGSITEYQGGVRPGAGTGEHFLAVVDTAEAAVKCAKRSGADVTALVSESCTLKFSGSLLDHIPPQDVMELCYDISNNMDISIDTKNSCLTLRGYWKHIEKAREGIHRLFLKAVQDGCLKPGYKEKVKALSKPATSSSFASLESHYDMLSELSPDILAVMRSKQGDFKPGISHTPGSTVVHFTFSSPEDLCHAISTFEQEYESLSHQLRQKKIPVPMGISVEGDLALGLDALNSRYRDASLTLVPENREIKVLAPGDQLPSITEELRDAFEKLQFEQPITSAWSGHGKSRSPVAEKSYEGAEIVSQEKQILPKSSIVLNCGANHKIIVCNDNILLLQVDAIVNPANSWLSHGGGLAAQIDKVSGGVVQQLSHILMSNQNSAGGIETGEAVYTEAGGNLRCRYVIHAVGPNSHIIQDEGMCKKLLEKTCLSALNVAKELGLRSVAFPAISSGLFGMNKEVVAETIIDTLVSYKQNNSTGSVLETVYVSVLEKETYCHFQLYALGVQSSLDQGTEV